MSSRSILTVAAVVCICLFAQTVSAEIILETEDLRLVISDDGTVRSLQDKKTSKEYISADSPAAIATVYRGGKPEPSGSWTICTQAEAAVHSGGEAFRASSVKLDGNKLQIEFGKTNLTAVYEVTRKPRYLAFKLTGLEGDAPDRIDLVQLNLKKTPYLGPWINTAYDESFGVCLCAGNIETNAGMNIKGDLVEMRAYAEKRVALEGTVAVLFAYVRDPAGKSLDPTKRYLDPENDFLDVMEIVERDFGLPSGAKNRRLPIQRESYWWCNPTPANVDHCIRIAKLCGFRIIVLSYQAFSKGAGHFQWNKIYPGGMDDLKKVTDKIRAAGLKPGLHLHYSKADKIDPYVSPVPDDRLAKERSFTLAKAVDETGKTIPVRENPEGSTLDKGRRILKIGKELIAYENFTTERPYKFTGCRRGHLGSRASAYKAGRRVDLLDVDTWVRFVRFDQDTDIQDETARRIAEICRKTGPYQFIYFDGTEDVHAPFWYNIPRAQYRTYRQIKPEPLACEAAINTHFSWHMDTRSNAFDTFHDAKNFVRRMPFRSAPVRLADFTRLQFGWVHRIEPDVLEYVFSRAAAWDCPASVVGGHDVLTKAALAPDCHETIRIWEDARLGGKLTGKQLQMLRTLNPVHHRFMCCGVQRNYNDRAFVGQGLTEEQLDRLWELGPEHHLFVNEKGKHELAVIEEIPDAAGGVLKAYSMRRETPGADCCVMVWPRGSAVKLELPVDPGRLVVMRPFGKRLDVDTINGKPVVDIKNRCYLCFKDMNSDEARRIMLDAQQYKAKSQKTASFKRPTYIVRRAASPIKIDGKLDEAAWRAAPEMGPFHFTWWKMGKKLQTSAKMLWDDKNLYVGHVCQDEHITARYTKHDDPVPKDDCFELMIAPNPDRPNVYFNIEWNLLGAYVDGHRAHGPKKPSVKWDAIGLRIAGTFDGTLNNDADKDRSWTCEVAIPLENFAKHLKRFPPQPGDSCNINLNRHGGDTNMQYSQWSKADTPKPAFHTPHRFGRIIFSEKIAAE